MTISKDAFGKIYAGILESKNETQETPLVEMVDIKESSPVDGDNSVQENPTGPLTEPGKIEFQKLEIMY